MSNGVLIAFPLLRDILEDISKKKLLRVLFIKKNGEERAMYCTRRRDYLPEGGDDLESRKRRRESDPMTFHVWDLEKKGWRAFRLDSVLSIDEVEEAIAEVEESIE